jgi:hypothetical protein
MLRRDSSIGVATSSRAGVQFPAGEKESSLLHSIQTGCEDHSASYPVDNGGGGAFAWVKRPGREVDHSPLPTYEVKNGGAIPQFHLHFHGVVRN